MYNRKVILTLLFSLIISLIIGVLFSKPEVEELMKQMFAFKVHSNKKYELVVAGDSRIYRGVSTDIIGEELDMTSINLGFSSAGFGKKMFDLIDKKIVNEPDNIIILGITPFSLTDQAIENGHINSIKNLKDEEVIEYLYLSKFKNLFVPTNPIKIWNNIFNKNKTPDNYIQKVNVSEGWVASDYFVPNQYLALESYKKTMTNTVIDKKTIVNLYRKIRDWNSNGFLVFGFTPPSSENMEELERQYSGFVDFEFVKGFIEAGGKWISLKDTYTSYDGSHLDEKSSRKLSFEIAKTIKSKTYLSGLTENTKIRTDYDKYTSKFTFYNDFENETNNVLITEIAHSGKKVLVSDSSLRYLGLYKTNTDNIINNEIKKILVEMFIFYEDENTSAKLVFEIRQDNRNILWEALEITDIIKAKKWGKIKFEIPVPDSITEKDQLKVYIVNSNKTSILIDGFTLNMF